MGKESLRIVIEPSEVQKKQERIIKNLKKLNFTLAKETEIPNNSASFYFPTIPPSDSHGEELLAAKFCLNELNEGTMGMIADIGFGYTGKFRDASSQNTRLYDAGTWNYLFCLGSKQKEKIGKEEIKRAVIQSALDPSNTQASTVLENLAPKTGYPSWFDLQNSTPIEKLVACYVDSNKVTILRKFLKYHDKTKAIGIPAGVSEVSGEVAINIPKVLKWFIPFLKAWNFINIYHEIAHKMTRGLDHSEKMYRGGLIRLSSSTPGIK